jgi:hypothetical protein
MNRETRRLSKIPEEVRRELSPFYIHKIAVASEERDCEKIDKLTDDTAERTRSGLAVSFMILYFSSFFNSFHNYVTSLTHLCSTFDKYVIINKIRRTNKS